MSGIIIAVGDRVRLYRQKAGLSQNELGEKAGLHNTYIGQVERGEKNITIDRLDKIIEALGLSYEVFYAKINNHQTTNNTASKCYGKIIQMDEKRQRAVLEIVEAIEKML